MISKVIDWENLSPTDAELDLVQDELHDVEPLHAFLKRLVKVVLLDYPWNDHAELVPVFDTSHTYQPGDRVAIPRRDSQEVRTDTWRTGRVVSVLDASNALQGAFQVVTVDLNGNKCKLATGIENGHPLPLETEWDDADEESLASDVARKYHEALLRCVQQAITEGRLDASIQGDKIARGALMAFGAAECACIQSLFAQVNELRPWLTLAEIIGALRQAGYLGRATDDIARLSLPPFLQEHGYRPLGEDCWISPERLAALNRQVERRPRVPRMPSVVAREQGWEEPSESQDYDGVPLGEEAEEQLASLEGDGELTLPPPPTLDEWRRSAPSGPVALATLTYQQIIAGFLPLTKNLAPLFPPEPDPLLAYLEIVEGDPIQCLVSREEAVIKALDQSAFYRVFQDREIVAGTRLWLERQSDWRYHLAPQPLPEPRMVRCKQAWIEGGRLRFDQVEIPMQYEGDPHVFKAGIRFEDLEALFLEAEQSGKSIADALWYVFQELTKENPGVTAHYVELFNAVFFRHRMCSPRSVIGELYSRQCFVPCGDGYFSFAPDQGIGRKGAQRKHKPVGAGQGHRVTTTRQEDGGAVATRDLWAELVADPPRMNRLKEAVKAYLADPVRPKVLWLRQVAHERIRSLLREERLASLTPDEFNRHVWQIGTFTYAGIAYRVDSPEADALLRRVSLEELQAAYRAGTLQIVGNQTWGSASSVYGAALRVDERAKEALLRKTLRDLLYGAGSWQECLGRAVQTRNGFGMNVATGILHALYPHEHILYNTRSVEALQKLGFFWPQGWQDNADLYMSYRTFASQLVSQLGFHHLSDVDWFMYRSTIPTSRALVVSRDDLWERYIVSLSPDQYIGWTIVHQRQMKGYYALWAEYLRFMDENPGAGDDAAREKTGVHWRGTMHARYLGLITEDRAVTPAGREFHQHPDMIDGILARQVMKWYYCVDLFCDPDPGYDVYPVFALLRILLDLPESEYGISLDELRFFVLPTKRLSECQDRVALIRRFRESPSLWQSKLDRIFLHTYVGRIGQILELCNLLQVTDNDVRIAPAHVQEAKWSLTAFLDLENEGLIPHYDNNAMVYLTMLRSTKSVFEFCGDLTNQVGM